MVTVTKWGIRDANGEIIADDFNTSAEARTIADSLWTKERTHDWTLFYYEEEKEG